MPHNLLKMPHFFFSDIVCTYAIQIFGIQMIKASYTFLLFNFPFECFVRPSLYYKFPHQKIISHFYSESPTSLPAPGSFRPSGPCHPPPTTRLKSLTDRKKIRISRYVWSAKQILRPYVKGI